MEPKRKRGRPRLTEAQRRSNAAEKVPEVKEKRKQTPKVRKERFGSESSRILKSEK